MFSAGDGANKQRQQLWSHSVGCAVVARILAKHVPGVDMDDAFFGGVFHDVGKLLFYDVIPDEYSEIKASFKGLSLVQEENFLMGTAHEEIGLASASSWELPDEVKATVGWHHRPEQATVCSEYAVVASLADSMAKHWGIGSEAMMLYSETQDALRNDYGLTDDQLEAIEVEARKSFEETMAAS